MQTSHARVISIAFAISVAIGTWMLFENGQRFTGPLQSYQASKNAAAPVLAPMSDATPLVPPMSVPEASTRLAAAPGGVFICRQAGRTIYRDHPCQPGESTQRQVVPVPGAAHSGESLEDLKRRAADMEAERLRDMPQRSAPAASTVQPAPGECNDIDWQVAAIDGMLRQPNSPQWIDYQKDRRKKLVDRRFSLGC